VFELGMKEDTFIPPPEIVEDFKKTTCTKNPAHEVKSDTFAFEGRLVGKHQFEIKPQTYVDYIAFCADCAKSNNGTIEPLKIYRLSPITN
jgi:hypothetical protein